MRNKAQIHIEIIISFVIFVGFLIFVLVFINPLATTSSKQINTEEVKQVILEKMSEKVGILSAIVDTSDDCYSLEGVSEYGSNFVEFKDADRKYTLYFSDIFGEGTISCSSKTGTNFVLGVYYEDEIIFEDYVKELKEGYETNYEYLKESLEVDSDFAFNFKNLAGDSLPELSATKESPTGVERDAQESPVKIIDSSGNLQDRILNLRVW